MCVPGTKAMSALRADAEILQVCTDVRKWGRAGIPAIATGFRSLADVSRLGFSIDKAQCSFGGRMQRREFITLLGSAAAAWPLAAHAQQGGPMRRIGVLFGGADSDPQIIEAMVAFKATLGELGWIEGRNLQIDFRFAAADVDRMRVFAKELIALQPDLLVGHTTGVIAALKRETKAIPIVFVIVSDPVGSGYVESLARPGGNITGFINIEASLSGKWIEILKEIQPRVTRAALMFNPATATYIKFYQEPFEAAARSSGIEPIAAPVQNAADIERVFDQFGNRPDAGLVLPPDVFTTVRGNLDLIISLAARTRMPTIYPYRYMVTAGGLISYGIDTIDLYRRAPVYIDRILKGAKPADLPVQLPTKFEMAVNLKTAKALGIEMPPTLLGRADEVVE
jgi:putative ABC transport system substrate-binding protein